MVSNRKDLTNC